MDDDEVALKAKLDQTEDIEERRELRKKIREIRNRKFEEELKKISGGEKTTSTLANDISSRKPTRVPTINNDEGNDPYELLQYTSEAVLQDLLNDTPFTETDKRRKIRARMRDVRNAEFDKSISTSTSTRSSTRERVTPSTVETTTKPEPVREPSPEPVREPSPEPVRDPSPEPVREPSPEPIREPSPEPIREPSPEPIREPSPEPVRESSPEPVRESSPERYAESRDRYNDECKISIDIKKMEYDSASDGEASYEGSSDEADYVDKSPQSGGRRNSGDFEERLKTREDNYTVMNLERPLSQQGEQVDFRKFLKKKSENPVVNLERKLAEPEQVDFRDENLRRKVEVVEKKDEPASGEQIDFRHALKTKVAQPVFDKTPAPATQVDFRNKLTRNVRTVTIDDKELAAEQKDFRVVLGKAPPSPKTGRRHKGGMVAQESIDRCDSPEPVQVNKMEALPEHTPSPTFEDSERVESPQNDTKTEEEPTKKPAKKAAPPPPAKKKAPLPKPKVVTEEEVENEELETVTQMTNHESTKTEIANQESDGEVEGIPRNKQVARAERTRRRQEAKQAAAEKTKEETSNDTDVKEKPTTTVELSPQRRSKKVDEVTSESRPERSSRRARRLQALENDSEKKVETTPKKKVETTPKKKVEITPKKSVENKEFKRESKVTNVNGTKSSVSLNHAVNGTNAHDDEDNLSKTETAHKNVEEEVKIEIEATPTPKMNGSLQNGNESEDKKETNKSRKSKEEDKVEVSSDLLAEINKPKDEGTPKKSIESQLKKDTPKSTTPLTGRAAERERERVKREEEREQRAAARAKERDDAAKKRKEQKDSFEKKMAEQRKLREVKQRSIGSNATARASRNAFKEKLESNASPRSGSPATVQVSTNLTKLLGWARKRTKDYEGVSVENFSESWSDGLAFAALIHSFCPDLIPIDELTKESRRRNFELAFSVAKDEGVMDLLDVEDMVNMRSPDPKSIMTYVHSVYQTFQQPQQEATS